jgi:hypothetical protein
VCIEGEKSAPAAPLPKKRVAEGAVVASGPKRRSAKEAPPSVPTTKGNPAKDRAIATEARVRAATEVPPIATGAEERGGNEAAVSVEDPPVASGSKRPASAEVPHAGEGRPLKRARLEGRGRELTWEAFEMLEETTIAWRAQIEAEVRDVNQRALDLNQRVLELTRKSAEGNAKIERARADLAKRMREEER